MDGNQLFTGMFKDDQEGQKLLLVPGADELMTQFEQKFQAIISSMFEFGLKVRRSCSEGTNTARMSLFRRKKREIMKSKTSGSV